MKRIVNVLFAGVLAMTVLSCSEEKKGYTLNGEISDVKNGMVYLKKYQDKSFIDVDSAVITDGVFKFEGACTEPLAYGLTTFKDSKRPLVFFLDNEEMQLKMNESEKVLTVTGSALNDLYAQNAPLTRQDGYSIDSLVSAHPASAVTPYFVVKDFAYKLNLEEMKALRAKLDASLDGTMYVNQIDDFIKRMENIQVGAVAPDFTLPDVDGNPVTLFGLRGKYVLIDFWASWCNPCRKSIPGLKDIYKEFADKGLEIISISIDKRNEDWQKALNEEQLPWPSLIDTKNVSKEKFDVRAVPTFFLVDENGMVVEDNLSVQEIRNKVKELLQ